MGRPPSRFPSSPPTPGDEAYADATGFQLGPREEVDGELSQVVTFWQPPRTTPSRTPAWFAWWIGLASGEVRREAMVSTRHYMVYGYSDFDAPLDIIPPDDAYRQASLSPLPPLDRPHRLPEKRHPLHEDRKCHLEYHDTIHLHPKYLDTMTGVIQSPQAKNLGSRDQNAVRQHRSLHAP
jgi:hypothetical protein